MAAGDTALWLHNKLGSTDDLWSGKSICSQLSREKLINIQDCFHALQSHVKVKLLLSFIHIPRRNIDQWQADLEEIISLGIGDPDPWVATIGEILREFPLTGALLMVEQDSRADSNMLAILEEMKLLVQSSAVCMMPLDCQYLNKASLAAAAGHIPEPSKHFTVKRKPKSAALRAEIIQKSSDTVLNKRNHASSSVPIKSRSFAKNLDITSIRSTPNRSLMDGTDFRSPGGSLHLNMSLSRSPITPLPVTPRPGSSKKDTKIKILEIEEMPVGAKEAKRRKKIADMAQETQKKDKVPAAAGSAAVTTSATPSTPTPQTYTPDYAAGLIAPAAPKMPITVLSVSSSTLSQPSPAYLPTLARSITVASTLTGISSLSAVSVPVTKQNLSLQLKQQLLQQPHNLQPSTQQSIPMMTPILISQKLTTAPNLATAQAGTVLSASATTLTPSILPTAVVRPQQAAFMQQGANIFQPQIMQLAQAPLQSPIAAQAAVPRKSLSLTKEQMIEAQEMFKASNKVSRPEKALILGFMAGSRDNPCPQQGDVLNIKLSEKEEVVLMSDGSKRKKIEDTYFQMNYATGEWKRFQKLREMPVS